MFIISRQICIFLLCSVSQNTDKYIFKITNIRQLDMLDRFLSVITKDPTKSRLNNKSLFSHIMKSRGKVIAG